MSNLLTRIVAFKPILRSISMRVAAGNAPASRLHRYRAQEGEEETAAGLLYPASRVISLRNVLLHVERLMGFLSHFKHQAQPYKAARPDTRLLLAALIGNGDNIGIRKMAAAVVRPDLQRQLSSCS